MPRLRRDGPAGPSRTAGARLPRPAGLPADPRRRAVEAGTGAVAEVLHRRRPATPGVTLTGWLVCAGETTPGHGFVLSGPWKDAGRDVRSADRRVSRPPERT